MTTCYSRIISAMVASSIVASIAFAGTGAAQANDRYLQERREYPVQERRHRHNRNRGNDAAAVAAGLLLIGMLAQAAPAQEGPRPKPRRDRNRGDIRAEVHMDGWTDKNWANSECMRVKEYKALVKSARQILRRDLRARPRNARAIAFSRRELARCHAVLKRFKARCRRAKARLAAR